MLKKIIQIQLFILYSVLFSIRLISFSKDGFKVQKILFPEDFSDPQISFISKDFDLDLVLSHPFWYLGKGRQCFVFENEDYVLKFLRYDRIAQPFYLHLFPYWQEKNEDKKKAFSQWIQSYSIALSLLSKEAALMYAKLNFHNSSKAVLLDPMGNKVNIDLKNCLFLIQKKVTPLDELFSDLKKQKNFKEIQSILDSFFNAVFFRMKKNIQNKTNSCFRNVGWLNKEIVEFDIGDLKINQDFQNKEIFQIHFISFTTSLRDWLTREVPEVVEYFDEKQNFILQKKLSKNIFN